MSKKPRNRNKAPESEEYPVGYGKPPKTTQFAKGRSGNPKGRPHKPQAPAHKLSDAPHDTFLEQEAYRNIKFRENGEDKELPAEQAMIRALILSGLKGNRLSLQYSLELLQAKEEESFKRKIWYYNELAKLKRDGEKLIAEHKKKNLPPPDNLFPHPYDIALKPSTAEAFVRGPETREELAHYEFSIATRDHFLLNAAHALALGKGPTVEHGGQTLCYYSFWAQVINQMLPRSLRLSEEQDISLVMNYRCLTKRERERRINTGEKHLQKLPEKPSPFVSKSETPFELALDKIIEKLREQNHPAM